MSRTPRTTRYGFDWGPFRVERVASDDRIGYVVTIRDETYSHEVMVRVSPAGRNWSLQTRGDIEVVAGDGQQ